MLPIVDDFERAISIAPEKQTIESMREGMDLIHKKLSHNLRSKGLEPMEAKGKVFDSEVHEAITSIPAPEESLKGCVVDEVEKGYLLNGQVIRFAKVVVGQ
jgi:molecular chaperone GrpE